MVSRCLDGCREGSALVFHAPNIGLVRIVDDGLRADLRAEAEEIDAGM